MASVRALIVTVCFARLLSGSARCRSGGCCDEVCGTYCNEHHTCHADDARCQNVGEACQLKNIEQQRTAAARDTSASEIAAREATSRSATRPQAAPPPSAAPGALGVGGAAGGGAAEATEALLQQYISNEHAQNYVVEFNLEGERWPTRICMCMPAI